MGDKTVAPDATHDVLQEACKLSKDQLNTVINGLLDQIAADPHNPVLREKAQAFAKIYNRRYNSRG